MLNVAIVDSVPFSSVPYEGSFCDEDVLGFNDGKHLSL